MVLSHGYAEVTNNRVTVHYDNNKVPGPASRNFLTFTEAIEHIYVAYNLKQQYPFPRLQQKSILQPRKTRQEGMRTIDEVLQELYPEKNKARPILPIVDHSTK